MPKVTLFPLFEDNERENGRTVPASCGETVYQILLKAGVLFPSSCGGRHECGKCLVFVKGKGSPITKEEIRHLQNCT